MFFVYNEFLIKKIPLTAHTHDVIDLKLETAMPNKTFGIFIMSAQTITVI